MPDMLILTEPDLRTLVPLDIDAIDTVERAFRALAEEAVVMPPILRLDVAEHNGEVDVCLLYTSPSPRDRQKSRMPSSA